MSDLLLIGQRVWIREANGDITPATFQAYAGLVLGSTFWIWPDDDDDVRRFVGAEAHGAVESHETGATLEIERVLVKPSEVLVGTMASLEFFTLRPSRFARMSAALTRSLPASVTDFTYDPMCDRLTHLVLRDEIDGEAYLFLAVEGLTPCGACGEPQNVSWMPDVFAGRDRSKESKWPPCPMCKGHLFVGTGEYEWRLAREIDGKKVLVVDPFSVHVRPRLGERRVYPDPLPPEDRSEKEGTA